MSGFGTIDSEAWKEEIACFNCQIQKWQTSIPEHLRFQSTDNSPENASISQSLRRLRVLLFLRANALRIQLYRPFLHSITSIMENCGYAQRAVEIAKDNIRVLSQMNQTSGFYRSQQTLFHFFLVTALAVLFLAVSHAPAEFSPQVREDFYAALDLVKGCSARSIVSQRLWKTIKGLKEVAPKLGLSTCQPTPNTIEPRSSAAIAMAGLAGHNVGGVVSFSQGETPSSLEGDPMNGQQMTYELTNLFEAAGGYGGIMVPNKSEGMMVDGKAAAQNELNQGTESHATMNGNEEEFMSIMQECF